MQYQAPETKIYRFGQNDQFYQSFVSDQDWPALKRQYDAELIEIPQHLVTSLLPLDAGIAAAAVEIDEPTKDRLIAGGLTTVGMVAAISVMRLAEIVGVNRQTATGIQDAYLRHIGFY